MAKQISVLVVEKGSNFAALERRDRCLEAGADAFLLKPLEEHKLLQTVKWLPGLA